MTNEQIIKEIFDKYKKQSDFDNRKSLLGMGITLSIYVKQFHKPGTDEYKSLYNELMDALQPLYDKAIAGVKTFDVEAEIKTKKGSTWGYSCSCEERTEQEVRERLKRKQFTNPYTDRIVKRPIFTKLEIKEKED